MKACESSRGLVHEVVQRDLLQLERTRRRADGTGTVAAADAAREARLALQALKSQQDAAFDHVLHGANAGAPFSVAAAGAPSTSGSPTTGGAIAPPGGLVSGNVASTTDNPASSASTILTHALEQPLAVVF